MSSSTKSAKEKPEQASTRGTSPTSSGPAGSHFEGKIGAYYLLSLLVRAEPRGLPGTLIDRVEFQRRGEGYPLDDVIVHAHDPLGSPALLEVQVKRAIKFTASDPVFRSVVDQVEEASRKPGFWSERHELAIAISRTSHKVDGAYQDVLTWARQLGKAATFINRINRPGSANPDMRTFVSTLRSHLREAGGMHDDETVWRLLRRLRILTFDFTATGSIAEELVRERAVRALHTDEASRASELWSVLIELAIEIAASGGDCTSERLLEDLRQKSFRLSSDRHNFSARKALAEASAHAFADISDTVGGVMLTRYERVASVRAALDTGRYVEIRGDAGVGKSGVLKHFAEQISGEAHVIVLSPGRTVPRGWLEMRAVLGYDGGARDLLSEMATDGGAILFLDNLDFFDDAERLTVVDLVREAAKVPGISVVATTRHAEIAEPSWLPSDILDRLGRAEPVLIDELSDAETDELRNAAPQLVALLAETHPARIVARNLFRLSRLASLRTDAPVIRTEVEMARQWWETADRTRDKNYRDRARLIRALANQVLSSAEPLDAKDFPAVAVNELVESQTLRDLGNDRVTFRHDVLSEWAIANLLFGDPGLVERLPLNRPASVGFSRGVEVAARMMIEHAADSAAWESFLDAFSKGSHSSWRRACLIALVRSEIGENVLQRASGYLLNKKGEGLRELIRLVIAVDVAPGAKWFSLLGLDPKLVPTNLNVPSAPSWGRLIRWLLTLKESLPAKAIPDVVDLYNSWSFGMLGRDPLTPALVPYLYTWLMEIETAEESFLIGNGHPPFNGELTRDNIATLEGSLRTSFLAFCNFTPQLAQAYLRRLRSREHSDETLRGILKFRGSLAQAAPEELSDITAELLIPKEEDDYGRGPFHDAFGYYDTDFIPASPSQGPFLELLIHAPEHGLKLIHKLIDHAIFFKSGGKDFGENAIQISSPDGSEIKFPWIQSYNWSRDVGSGPIITTCALMALEAWGHRRVDAGEPIENVLLDVIGFSNPPAAYLLVAVDLLLSHWPKSCVAAIPFLACPELLILDRQRAVHDNMEIPDLFGLKSLQKEPVGAASVASLKMRPSRHHRLEEFLGSYALDENIENRDKLAGLLHRAITRLDSPNEQSDLSHPAFMAIHALNVIDPKNWRETTVQTEQGVADGWEYVAPEAEKTHMQPLQDAYQARRADAAMESHIRVALNNARQSSPAFAAAAIDWAQKQTTGDGMGDSSANGDDASAIDARRGCRRSCSDCRP